MIAKTSIPHEFCQQGYVPTLQIAGGPMSRVRQGSTIRNPLRKAELEAELEAEAEAWVHCDRGVTESVRAVPPEVSLQRCALPNADEPNQG